MIDFYNAFCEAAELDKRISPWKGRRRKGKIYGRFMISSPGGDWYDRFVGVDFLAEIMFTKNRQGKRSIARVVPVRFESRDAIRGKPIPGKVVSMI